MNGFADGLVGAGLSKLLPKYPRPLDTPSYHGRVQSNLVLLKQYRTVLEAAFPNKQVQYAAAAVLFHFDLHKRNVFVSDDDSLIITGIIDWQSSSIELAFWYVDEFATSRLVYLCLNRLPHGVDDDDLCAQAYEVCTELLYNMER